MILSDHNAFIQGYFTFHGSNYVNIYHCIVLYFNSYAVMHISKKCKTDNILKKGDS